MRRRKKINIFWLLFIIVVLFITISIYISNTWIQVTKYEISNEKIPKSFDGFKILQLTDLHSKEFGEDNKRLLKKIDEASPDIIVMTGDMVTSTDASYETFYTLTEQLVKEYDIYYIVGNHEQAINSDKLKAIKMCIGEMSDKDGGSVTILDNSKKNIYKDGEYFTMYGMWFHLKYYVDVTDEQAASDYYFDENSMEEIMGKASDNFNLLLTHNPVYLDTYSKWGADLVLSGHMHGGMINIPFKGGLFSPEKELFPYFYGGRYTKDNTALIVGRGLGNGNLGFRWFNRPELCLITLRSRS